MKQRKYHILTDTHFGHDKLVKSKFRERGFEEVIFDNIEKTLKPNDVLIHLGDVSFYQNKYWHDKLCTLVHLIGAKCWLVRGNHDNETLSWYLSRGWDFVGDEILIEHLGREILFTHEPVKKKARFSVNIHGHLHNLEWRHDVTRYYNLLVHIEKSLGPFDLKSLIDNYDKQLFEWKEVG